MTMMAAPSGFQDPARAFQQEVREWDPQLY
jgi:hypothetical protein